MKIDVLTIFPELFESPLGSSIFKRAQDKGLLEVNCINFRDYSSDKHKKVDDIPYGGGAGMVLSVEPIVKCLNDVATSNSRKVLLSPKGKLLSQQMLNDWQENYEQIILVAGHYEGFDERVNDYVDESVSIGDFVLSGGEIPALVVIDAIMRIIPGVIGDQQSYENDSFYKGLLDYPSFTRPKNWEGKEVPEVLMSGHHKEIENFRVKKAIVDTLNLKPDLLAKKKLTKQERKLLKEYFEEETV
jgi:tRNA (guanine37-N1)-methyltransferase